MAHAVAARGALPEAAEAFRAAIAEIERVSRAIRLEERRAAFLADKWEVYVELALLERARGRFGASFEVSERLRARQLLDLLGRGRIAAQPPAGQLVGREQTLRRRIDELTGLLTSEPTADARTLRIPAIRAVDRVSLLTTLARAQREYAALLLELRERSPDYATIVSAEVARPGDVRSALAPDEVLLEYLLGESGSVVFVVTRDGIDALDLAADRRTVARLVDLTRGTLARPDSVGALAPWRAPLRRLYRVLVGPAEEAGLLEGKRRLLIAPHAELHYLPFAALLASGRSDAFLVERFELGYVPSASVWLGLRQRATSPVTDRVLALAPRHGLLPGADKEAEAIARLYGARADVYTGPSAREHVLTSSASRYAVVHIASSGILNKHNPLFSFVELGAGDGEDGRLEVHEVFGLDLKARLVVLSACQTALGSGAIADVPAGDDWVGLVRAFLFAGASSVIGTLWPIEDEVTAKLVERFYAEYAAGVAPATALARAQRALLRDAPTASPFFWSAFVTVGDP
jgi:CHAT domain-containing protein